MRPLELLGRRFGRLIVVARYGTVTTPGGTKRIAWICECECGGTTVVRGHDLVQTRQVSCGCYNRDKARVQHRTHGHTVNNLITAEYHAWSNAKTRCTNTHFEQFADYGGRGIRMCQQWAESFEAFLADMGPCPPGLTLDRKDTDGHYEPGNCRWATYFEQANNRRNGRYVELDGERLTVADASRRVGIDSSLVYGRLNNGWPVERAFGLTT